MRAVLDTNVLLSALLFRGTPRLVLELAIRGEVVPVTSPPLLAELEELLGRKFRFPAELVRLTRAEFEALAEVVEPGPIAAASRDPDDDVVLAIAVAGRAEAVVTGDGDLLVLGEHRGIPILDPAGFLRRWRGR